MCPQFLEQYQAQQVFGEFVAKWFNYECYSYGQMLNKSQENYFSHFNQTFTFKGT